MHGSWLIWIKSSKGKYLIYLLNTLPDDIYNLVMAYTGLAEIDVKHISAEQQAFQ